MEIEQTSRKIGFGLVATGLLGLLGVGAVDGFHDAFDRDNEGRIIAPHYMPISYQIILGASIGIGGAGALIGAFPIPENRKKENYDSQ
ncbi:hypothetical protein J4218_06735 [Candidatus Pacearchaeota archaeon]|nr:hypothetical protein [Candidatus Pacearchaeota archaeon]